MIYVSGMTGFIGGFILGQMIIYFLLRHRRREDLLADRNLRWTYGLFNWIVAALGAYSFVLMHQAYFPQ